MRGIGIEELKQERIGQVRINHNGEKGICVGFEDNATMASILLENGEVKKYKWSHFDKGSFGKIKYINRLGEEKINNQGEHMVIISYRNAEDIDVLFDSGYIAKTQRYSHFTLGCIKDIYFPNVQGKGFIGEGKYGISTEIHTIKVYKIWESMLDRCYGRTASKNNPSYKECEVDNRWYNYQSFGHWIEDNGYSIKGQKMCLDKDILLKNNKKYGPDTCCIVPNEINVMLTNSKIKRGNYPIGVHYEKNTGKYRAVVSRKRIGSISKAFITVEEAFLFYKEEKEKYIKYIADIYKEQIPIHIYKALYNYKIEITD